MFRHARFIDLLFLMLYPFIKLLIMFALSMHYFLVTYLLESMMKRLALYETPRQIIKKKDKAIWIATLLSE